MKSEAEITFEKIYSQNYQRIYRLCCSIVEDKEAAKDLLQEIFLKVWLNLNRYRSDASISTWIYRIAINSAITYQTKEAKNKLSMPANLKQEEVSNKNNTRIDLMSKCILKLNLMDRMIISQALEGMSYQEINAATGLTISNIGSRLSRIKKRLKKCILENENK